MPLHKNTLFLEIAYQTNDNCCNNTISITKILPQLITTGCMKSKRKTKCNIHQDLSNNSVTMQYCQEKENTIQEITNFIQQYLQ